tara:strand:- start:41 stop:337 length:297 start_codon:yes stop_codon:yes gene_type:complete
MSDVYNKGDKDFDKALNRIAKRFKGKGGGPDAETLINANKHDINLGYVSLWSDNNDITNLINRSRKYILSVRDYGETVEFKMAKGGFRSCCHAFKVGK